jgi:hypothetical protein
LLNNHSRLETYNIDHFFAPGPIDSGLYSLSGPIAPGINYDKIPTDIGPLDYLQPPGL